MKELYVYTFPKHSNSMETVESLTREQCVELYTTNHCDRLPLEEFAHHHNDGMIDLESVYITIK